MAMIIERWDRCGVPLPPETDRLEDKDGLGCRLDLGHEGAHLVEVRRLGAMKTSERFVYRARFGGL